jgi:hypothetical protein
MSSPRVSRGTPAAMRRRIMLRLTSLRFLLSLSASLSACAAGSPAGPPDAPPPAVDATRCADDPDCVARTCASEQFACGAFRDVGGDAFDCGTCIGTAACVDHVCTIPADAREDNDDLARATWLGSLDDRDDAYLRLADLTIDSATDHDWFQFHVTDAFDAGNPRISLSLTAAARHELVVYFKCDSVDEATVAFCGESQNAVFDPALGIGCVANAASIQADIVPYCKGIADGGTVTLRVGTHQPPRGDPYELGVMVR